MLEGAPNGAPSFFRALSGAEGAWAHAVLEQRRLPWRARSVQRKDKKDKEAAGADDEREYR